MYVRHYCMPCVLYICSVRVCVCELYSALPPARANRDDTTPSWLLPRGVGWAGEAKPRPVNQCVCVCRRARARTRALARVRACACVCVCVRARACVGV